MFKYSGIYQFSTQKNVLMKKTNRGEKNEKQKKHN
jgi:hypothetical protein